MFYKINNMKPNKLTAGVCLLMFTLFSCKENKQPTEIPKPIVNVVAAGVKTIPIFSEYVAQTYGKADIAIQSRVDGWITGIHFKEGEPVKKGQLLYTIDDQPIQTKIDAANARLAQVKTMLVKAKSDLDRVEPLTAMNALSKRDLDAAKAAFESARSEVNVAEASLANAKIELSYTKILSPVSGIIGITKVLVGDYVGKLGAGPLNTVSSIDEIMVRFSVSESEFLTYRKAMAVKEQSSLQVTFPAAIQLSDGTMYAEQGKISLANREVDPQTGSIIIQAMFPNPNAILRPGQYVKLRIRTGTFTDAILVPQQAVNQMQNIYQVFLLGDSNKVIPTIIKPGKRVGANWIISSGLKAGDKVAVIGNAIVKPNIQVTPKPMNWSYDSTMRQ